jgi:hypothetical protein
MEQLKTSQHIAIMYLEALLFIQQTRGLQCGAQNAFCALIRRSFAAPNLFATAWQDGSAKNLGSSSKRGFYEDGSAKNPASSSKTGFHEDGSAKNLGSSSKRGFYEDGSAKNSGLSSKRGFYEDGSAKNFGSSSKRGFYEDGSAKAPVHPQKGQIFYL